MLISVTVTDNISYITKYQPQWHRSFNSYILLAVQHFHNAALFCLLKQRNLFHHWLSHLITLTVCWDLGAVIMHSRVNGESWALQLKRDRLTQYAVEYCYSWHMAHCLYVFCILLKSTFTMLIHSGHTTNLCAVFFFFAYCKHDVDTERSYRKILVYSQWTKGIQNMIKHPSMFLVDVSPQQQQQQPPKKIC